MVTKILRPGVFERLFTKVGDAIFVNPPLINLPGFGPNGEGISSFGGPGPEIPHDTGDPGRPDPDPDHGEGDEEPEIDWDKIFDPSPDPLLPDPLIKWSLLFQSWCIHSSKHLVKLAKAAPKGNLVKFQAPWLAYVVANFPKYTLGPIRFKAYLDEWNDIFSVIASELKPEVFSANDIKDFGDLQTLLSKLITQFKDLGKCRWTGFMTSQQSSNPPIGTGSSSRYHGGLSNVKPPSSSGSNSGESEESDSEDFNPGDSAEKRPDQEQAQQRRWEAEFLAWRTDLILVLNTVRMPNNGMQMGSITFLTEQLRTGPAVGSRQADINTVLTQWNIAAQAIIQLTSFTDLPVANLNVRLNTILGLDLDHLRAGLAALVAREPNYQWAGDR